MPRIRPIEFIKGKSHFVRAFTSGLVNVICMKILASMHKTCPLLGLVFVKFFAIVLQYRLTYMAIL